MDFQEFQILRRAQRNAITVDRAYIEMAGSDLVAGVLLGQIAYWHEPDKHGKSKLRVYHEGHYWLARHRADWQVECGISPKQYDRAIEILENLKLVVTDTTMYAGKPCKVIRIDEPVFMAAYLTVINRDEVEAEQVTDTAETPENKLENRVEERSLPLGNNEIDERVISITAITTANMVPPQLDAPAENLSQPLPEKSDPKPAHPQTKLDPRAGRTFRLYQQIISPNFSPLMAERIREDIADVPLEVIEYAFAQTELNNVKKWNYTLSIIEKCRANHWKIDTPRPKVTPAPKVAPTRGGKKSISEIIAGGEKLFEEQLYGQSKANSFDPAEDVLDVSPTSVV